MIITIGLVLSALAFVFYLHREDQKLNAKRVDDENALVDAVDLPKNPNFSFTKVRRKPKRKKLKKKLK